MHNPLKNAPGPDADHVWVYRVCDARGYSHKGKYRWPTEEGTEVTFEDWDDSDYCGGGGHGWLLGMGDADLAGVDPEILARGLWYLLRVPRTEIRCISWAQGKVKFRTCTIERVNRRQMTVLPSGYLGVATPEINVVEGRIVEFNAYAGVLRVDSRSPLEAWRLASDKVRAKIAPLVDLRATAPRIGVQVRDYLHGFNTRRVIKIWHGPYDWGDTDLPSWMWTCGDVIRGARAFLKYDKNCTPWAACRGKIQEYAEWAPVSPPRRWGNGINAPHTSFGVWYEISPDGALTETAHDDLEVCDLTAAAMETNNA